MRRLVGVLLLLAFPALADDTLVTFVSTNTTSPLAYVEYLPPGYSTSTAAERLVVFFHGVGESGPGTDATSVYTALTAHGPLALIRQAGAGAHRFQSSHRAIVLAARNPSGLWDKTLASQFFAWALTRYRVDTDHVYVTGISAGGGPTWTVPLDNPGVVAAVVPICPVRQLWSAFDAAEYRHVAVWAFHGFGDPTVPRQESILWMNSIGQAVSRDAQYPEFMSAYPFVNGQTWLSAGMDETAAWTPSGYVWSPGIGTSVVSALRYTMLDRNDHFIWGDVYGNDDVWNWLFAQRRSANVDPGTDAGVPDAGVPDAGVPDAGVPDAGVPDAGVPDAGVPDAGGTDAGAPDAGAPDAGESDAGDDDAGPGVTDAGPETDAGASVDAGDPPGMPAVPGDEGVSGGCGCTAGSGVESVALLALALAAHGRRRRHQHGESHAHSPLSRLPIDSSCSLALGRPGSRERAAADRPRARR